MKTTMRNFREHCPGIWRGSRPESIPDIKALYTQGIRTIFSLQSNFFEGDQIDDENFWTQKSGITFVHHSMSLLFPPSRTTLVSVFSRLTDALKDGPVYIHCHDGVDRTGVALMMYDTVVRGIPLSDAADTLLNDGFHKWRYWWWLPFVERSILDELALNEKTAAEIREKQAQ